MDGCFYDDLERDHHLVDMELYRSRIYCSNPNQHQLDVITLAGIV